MVPVSLHSHNRSSRFLYALVSLSSQYVRRSLSNDPNGGSDSSLQSATTRQFARRDFNKHSTENIVFACLIPVLVLLSGLFAGLTLGYMSLDETQLHVLSISGTPKQREYASKIKPIRENGHMLLVTLLLANMIVNETLPVISDPILGGGFQSVVVSTVLIVIFSEIIPQSVFTRHGLYLGAKMTGPTKILIYALAIVSWPIAKLLEFALGPHHGIIYRRAELKELIAMHSMQSPHGGDLNLDTVTIIGATLDLQEKVVKQAMTPISDVFMLSIDAKLDYKLLSEICKTGHSRVPVYEEVEVVMAPPGQGKKAEKVKKIIGILLVKSLVLLDPNDAVPLRKLPLNKVPFVPNNETLLGILDRFQEGRSHMAIVSRFSAEKAASVKQVVKRTLTQRLRDRVMGDSDSSDEDATVDDASSQGSSKKSKQKGLKKRKNSKDSSTSAEDEGELSGGSANHSPGVVSRDFAIDGGKGRGKRRQRDIEMGPTSLPAAALPVEKKNIITSSATKFSALEQSMPADAVLAKEGAAEFLQSVDPAVMPLGIITLEDVLEELIGEEIYDEFDPQGAHGDMVQFQPETEVPTDVPPAPAPTQTVVHKPMPLPLPISLKGLNFLRSRSAPPIPRDGVEEAPAGTDDFTKEKEHDPSTISSSKTAVNPIQDDSVVIGSIPPKTELQASQPVVMPKPLRGFMEKPPLPATVATGVTTSAAASVSTPAVATTKPVAFAVPPASTAGRPVSPAPPLEAFLLDRKRRMAAAAASGSTNAAPSNLVRVPSSSGVSSNAGTGVTAGHAKGKGFKSSPLSPSSNEEGGVTGAADPIKGDTDESRTLNDID